MRRFTRRTAIVAAGIAVALGGGAAFAFWLNSGTATAEGQTATGAQLTVTNVLTGSPAMVPGSSQGWSFQVNNDGDASQNLDATASTVTITPFSSTAVDASKPACTEADYQVTAVAFPSSVSAHSYNTGSFTLTFLNDASRDQANCKGVKVPLKITAQTAA